MSADDSLKCEICNTVFKLESYFRRHMRNHNDVFQCTQCEKMFDTKYKLKKHMAGHDEQKNFFCDVCDKAFFDNSSLRKHLKVHSGKKSYACNMCGKLFIDRGNLKVHTRVHTSEKPHLCEFCGKGFTTSHSLKSHVRVHTNERPYTCTYCQKTFKRHKEMTEHVRLHTGIRPYKCTLCDKAFCQKGNLKSHFSHRHHNEAGSMSNVISNKNDDMDNDVGTIVYQEADVKARNEQNIGIPENKISENYLSKDISHASINILHTSPNDIIKQDNTFQVYSSIDSHNSDDVSEHVHNDIKVQNIKMIQATDDGDNGSPVYIVEETLNPTKGVMKVKDTLVSQTDNKNIEEKENEIVSDLVLLQSTDHHSKDKHGRSYVIQVISKDGGSSLLRSNENKHSGSINDHSNEHVMNICNPTDQEVDFNREGNESTEGEEYSLKTSVNSCADDTLNENNILIQILRPVSDDSDDEVDGEKCTKVVDSVKDNSISKETIYKCHLCLKEFQRKRYLTDHIKRHTDIPTYKCDLCGVLFKRDKYLKRHMKRHTDVFTCDQCGKEFCSSYDLKRHLLRHTDQKDFKCDICEKRFHELSNLRKHLKVHSGKKSYACNTCGKLFIDNGGLKTHTRVHTGEKPYLCEFCGKAFTTSHSLKSHIRVHTNERPYVCTYCQKTFKRHKEMTEHVRLHTGIRPYKCTLCDKTFCQKGNLKSHISHRHRNEAESSISGLDDRDTGHNSMVGRDTQLTLLDSATSNGTMTAY